MHSSEPWSASSATPRRTSRLRHLLDFLLPPVCLGCRGPIALGDSVRLVCRPCRARLRPIPWPRCARCDSPRGTGAERAAWCQECGDWPPVLRCARSCVVLEPPATELVHALKYGGWEDLGGFMGERMARLLLPHDSRREATLVVPVPTTPLRLRQRGYNQASLIAQAYATGARLRCLAALERIRGSGTQVALQPAERMANVAGAFHVRSDVQLELPGAHVILVDDVLTTGATARAAASALGAGGVRAVSVVTFARALY